MPDPIRVVLVEDNQVFREALELLLGLRPGLEIVASVGDGTTAVPLCRELQPHVVLLDYRMPGLDGVQTTLALRAAVPATAVVCLTAAVSRQEQEALAAAGAFACLTKDAQLDEIVATLERAAADRRRPAEG